MIINKSKNKDKFRIWITSSTSGFREAVRLLSMGASNAGEAVQVAVKVNHPTS